jgi:cytochrome c-type biogenesis protein CcmH/NrfF
MKLGAFALALALSAAAAPATAQDDPEVALARQAHELSRELMSPYCPGRTLADCPSPDAGAVRDEIRAALRGGEPVDSVRARIESRFGAQVIGVPTTPLGWAIPIVVLAAGALALGFALRRVVSQTRVEPRIASDVAARLEQELRNSER